MTYIIGVTGANALTWAKLKTKLLVLSRVGSAPRSLIAPGEALDEATRGEMESALGFNLKDVRIHQTKQAGELARMLQAEAFTIGADIFAAEGKLSTATSEGKDLLAHELTHVIQQTRPQPAIPIADGPGLQSLKTPYPVLTPILVPQLATSNPFLTGGDSVSEAMEAMAETAEQTVRSTGESLARTRAAAVQVDAEEIADLVYRLMQQELLLEKDRVRR